MSRKPRILMVTPTPGRYGGMEAFTATVARETLDSGEVEVRLVYRLRKGGELTDNLTESMKAHQVEWRLMRGLDLQYLRDLLWADVVNCHFPLVYATYPARALGKKLVVTVENRRFESHGLLFRLGLRIAHARWYISSFVADSWEGASRWRNSLIVPAVSKLPEIATPPRERKGFLFIARWVPLKGLEELIEAYATAAINHTAHPLTLIGDGELRSHAEELIRDLGIGAFVNTPGFVTQEEKCRLISRARWNVAPAAFPEDLGLSPIESRACGVPSIVSDIGGLPEAAGKHSLRCKPGDVASLRAAIEAAATMDHNTYETLSRKCKATLSDYLPSKTFYVKTFTELAKIP